MQKRHFTLVELMAAMVVLVIMMGFLFKFIMSAQTLWAASERNARVYENAQVFFELFGRDLTGAFVSEAPGQEVGFYLGPKDGTDGTSDFLAFVAESPIGVRGNTQVGEVHYRGGKAELTPTLDPDSFLITRLVVGDQDSDGNADGNWDFYGKKKDDVTDWVDTFDDAEAQEVIDGVEKIDVTCYSSTSSSAMGDKEGYLSMPRAVKVTLTLVDQVAVDRAKDLSMGAAAVEDALAPSRRQFTKIIFLNR